MTPGERNPQELHVVDVDHASERESPLKTA